MEGTEEGRTGREVSYDVSRVKLGLLLHQDNLQLENQLEQATRRLEAGQAWVEVEVVRARLDLGQSLALVEAACRLVEQDVAALIVGLPGQAATQISSLGI